MIRINLAPSPEDPRRRGRRARLGIVVGATAVGLMGTLLGWSGMLAQQERRLTQSVVDTARELTMLKELLGQEGRLRDDSAELSKRIQSLQALMHRRGTTLHILDALLDSIPHDLWITTLEGRGRELRAMGATRSAGAVADLLSNLRASRRFDDVDLVVARQDLGQAGEAPLLFEITCRFGG